MQKSKYFLSILFTFILIMLIFSSICYATDSENLTIESLETTAPSSGIYGEGTEITITMKFNKPIKGTVPKLSIYFGKNKDAGTKEVNSVELTEFSNTVNYKYTIVSGDNGELNFDGFINTSEYQVETEDGTKYNLISPFGGFENKIYADTTITRADLSNANFEWSDFTDTSHSYLKLKMKNANIIENNEYYVHISHDKNETFNLNSSDSIYNNTDVWAGRIGNNNEINYIGINDLIATNGDLYIWICEIDKTYKVPKILVKGQKIERLAKLPLGSRLKAYFFNDETSTFCWEPKGGSERKINIKIGTISDKSILKAIKKGESNCLSQLLEFAKTADSIYTGTVPLGQSNEIVSKMNLVNDAYYYVYMELEDEDGKYYPVEDVSLYQALVYETKEGVSKNLFDYLDSKFKWNLEEDSNKEEDNTVAGGTIPQAGVSTIIIITAIIGASVLGVIAYRKVKNMNF